jgi:hypothetical protein
MSGAFMTPISGVLVEFRSSDRNILLPGRYPMPQTHFRFPWDARSIHSLEMRGSTGEPTTVDLWRSANSANDRDDVLPSSLDSFWIDLGGEG